MSNFQHVKNSPALVFPKTPPSPGKIAAATSSGVSVYLFLVSYDFWRINLDFAPEPLTFEVFFCQI